MWRGRCAVRRRLFDVVRVRLVAERVVDELRLEDKGLRALGALVDLGRLAVKGGVREEEVGASERERLVTDGARERGRLRGVVLLVVARELVLGEEVGLEAEGRVEPARADLAHVLMGESW